MAKNIRAVPAILANDIPTLEKLVRQIESFTDYVQFDLMDGKFVSSKSVTCRDIAATKTTLSYEAHLMILQPEDCILEFHRAGAKKIVFHYEAVSSPVRIINLIRQYSMQVGLAVNPKTSLAEFRSLIPELDSILFMAVNPGFYGAPFIPEVLEKIKNFRKLYSRMEIGIDGGVKENNIVEIAKAGVDVIFVGSAVSLTPDPAASFRRLNELARSAV